MTGVKMKTQTLGEKRTGQTTVYYSPHPYSDNLPNEREKNKQLHSIPKHKLRT